MSPLTKVARLRIARRSVGLAEHRQIAAEVIPDEALIGQIANGDKDALRILFTRHNLRVFRFLLRIVNNQAAAEDLLNEVFLEVWRHANRFQSRSLATTWILAIARNKALSSLRRRPFEALDDKVDLQDPGDNPEMAMQKVSRNLMLQEALQGLSAAHREVIDLVYYHEQSIDEVAEIIGAPQNTVKTRLFYARKQLAELMSSRGVDASCLGLAA